MPKSGQARVLTAKQQKQLFKVILQHRHPDKNTSIMQVSFKLGLRAQEIALLQIKEVAQLNSAAGTDFLITGGHELACCLYQGCRCNGPLKIEIPA